MDKKFSLSFVWLGVIPCLLAMDNFLSSSLNGKPGGAFTSIFPEAALPTQSGYVLVNVTSQSRMFYAFYEALAPDGPVQDVPIILWLQGGPGCSSMTGNFYEFGPWQIGSDMRLHKNNNTWNTRYALLFVDSPVGTGFSIAEKDEDIPMNEEHVVAHLFSVLTEFFQLNPSFQSRPLFVGGESYGGKYVPALGYYIMLNTQGPTLLTEKQPHECSNQGRVSFRLYGVFIGNGLTHPVIQVRVLCHQKNQHFLHFRAYKSVFIKFVI